VSPGDHFAYRPLDVLEPFDARAMVRILWARILADRRISHLSAAVREVDCDGHRLTTTGRQTLGFDLLVMTTGSELRPMIPGATTVGSPGATHRLTELLAKLCAGRIDRIAFAVPPGVTWTLPIYELALRLGSHGEPARRRTCSSPHRKPSRSNFGAKASKMVGELLADASIRLHTQGLVERHAGARSWLKLPAGPPADAWPCPRSPDLG
jgi:sulfide:quinone oxidoreductase